MKVGDKWYRPIWADENRPGVFRILDQRLLPHEFIVVDVDTVDMCIAAIKDMYVRGAPLIGATAAWGVYLALYNSPEGDTGRFLEEAGRIREARPTAVNLAWAVDAMLDAVRDVDDWQAKIEAARQKAVEIADSEAEACRMIGEHGLPLIQEAARTKKQGEAVNVLTHCNAGWLACVDYGTATAPVYLAHDRGIPVHVWVDETRPLNQGARLTAWELGRHGVPHTVITDNAGGHLMQHGMVDVVITGTDRTTHTGDVANKIGTYLKALAAKDNGIPFYVALPSSTIDWDIDDGVGGIPIEMRDPHEVRYIQGLYQGRTVEVLVPPESSDAANVAFDVTPARLVSALITERGVCRADKASIAALFPDKVRK